MPNEVHDTIIHHNKKMQRQRSMTIDLDSNSEVSVETDAEDNEELFLQPEPLR